MQAARVLSLRVPPERLEEVTSTYRNVLLPYIEDRVPGFSALLLLVNPDTGSVLDITLFESEEDRRESEREGSMLDRKMDTLVRVLGEPPHIENYELRPIS